MNDQEKVRNEKLEKAKTRLRESYRKIEEDRYKNSIIYVLDTHKSDKKYKYKSSNKI
tara:strand:- start:92 stop:262 length:171 start_codon:yes stop_codon:yes gene_type:complete